MNSATPKINELAHNKMKKINPTITNISGTTSDSCVFDNSLHTFFVNFSAANSIDVIVKKVSI